MVRRALGWVLLYGVGAVVVCGWSLSRIVTGSVTSENLPGVIVFPFAWLFGYWGVVGPLLAARQVWRLQATLERYAERRGLGLDTAASEQELEDTLTLLAMEENPLPERWARRLVRGLLARARSASEGASGV